MVTFNQQYSEAIAYLNSLIDYERKPDKIRSLQNFEKLLTNLGNPHLDLKCILVAGTKGKGSTATLIATALKNAGFKTGLYLSPHIFDYRERIQIDNTWISMPNFAHYLNTVKKFHSKQRGMRTVFETLTAMAFLYFKDNNVDYAVIEVGLGGRLDATNVVNQIVTIFTPIDYDHTNILGNTIEEIASEKAGVIKKSCPVISAIQQPPVEKILKETANQYNASISFLQSSMIHVIESSQYGSRFAFNDGKLVDVFVPLSGNFQIYNSALATMALRRIGIEKPNFSGIELPGRFQVIHEVPIIVVDIAHNPFSIRTVMDEIENQFHPSRFVVVFAVSRDKDIEKMLEILASKADVLILTEYSNPRSMPSRYLFDMSKKFNHLKRLVFDDALNALEEAKKIAQHKDLILVTGSVYLVSDILKNLHGGNYA